jgi:hypothetical protein
MTFTFFVINFINFYFHLIFINFRLYFDFIINFDFNVNYIDFKVILIKIDQLFLNFNL